MVNTKLYHILLSSGLTAGGLGLGWILMKAIVPSKEEMLKKLPEEATTPEALSAANRRNEEFMMILQENIKSNNPVWRVMGIEEVKERKERRKELQEKREAKLKDQESSNT